MERDKTYRAKNSTGRKPGRPAQVKPTGHGFVRSPTPRRVLQRFEPPPRFPAAEALAAYERSIISEERSKYLNRKLREIA
jgi:hypothetical protein